MIIKFIYGNNKFEKNLESKNVLITSILSEYSQIINKNIKELYFLYKGRNISFNNNEKINDLNNNNISIFVFNLKNKKEYKEFNQIICPDCKEIALIDFVEDDIITNNCINKHNTKNPINEFMKNQYIKELKCNICKNDKYLYNNKIYICSCKKNICPLCAISHDKTHNMIDSEYNFYKCIKHKNMFISYCTICNINLCDKCEEQHNIKHKRISYKEKRPNERKIDEIKNEIKFLENKIKQYKKEIKRLNNFYQRNMNNIINDLDKYILLYENIYKSTDFLNNYESIENLYNFKNKRLIKDIMIF